MYFLVVENQKRVRDLGLVFSAVFNQIAVALNIVSVSFIWSSRLKQSQVINKFTT
jgi:hypothetical protein